LHSGAQQIARFGVKRYLVKPLFEERVLEVLAPEFAAKLERAAPEKMVAIRSLRVLVAEDNLINQRVVTRFLERDGHTTELASDGREAVAAFQRHSFDVILMDVQMPEMDGLTATREIRKLERSLGIHTPIIALTAHSVDGDRERCIEAGMDGFVSKPIRIAELRAALAASVQESKGEAA
jgi:CheY-like chemotaxis protein